MRVLKRWICQFEIIEQLFALKEEIAICHSIPSFYLLFNLLRKEEYSFR